MLQIVQSICDVPSDFKYIPELKTFAFLEKAITSIVNLYRNKRILHAFVFHKELYQDKLLALFRTIPLLKGVSQKVFFLKNNNATLSKPASRNHLRV